MTLTTSLILASILITATAAAAPLPIHVAGTQVLDSKGSAVHLRGVDICSMEWTAQGDHVLQSIDVATTGWHANIIRLPLCQDRWFGKTDDSSGDKMDAYHKLVDSVVDEAAKHGAYIILDLHWSDMDQWGQNIGQHFLPDDNSLQFWQAVASRYANRPNVLFDLYNEPHDASWDVWKNGGTVTEKTDGKSQTYHTPGMQACLDAIRNAGAKNVVIVGGLGWASQLDMPDSDLLNDGGGNGIIYVNHFYPGWETIDSWKKRMDTARPRFAMIVSEFGPGQPYGSSAHQVSLVLQYLREHDMNWTAWCMHPQAGPCLIKDWTYAPTPEFGALVKQALAGEEVPIAPRLTTSPNVTIYADKLGDQWASWSSATVDLASTEQSHSGTHSIKVTAKQYQNLMLGVPPIDAGRFNAIDFWLYAPSSNLGLSLTASIMDAGQPPVNLTSPAQGTWTHYTIPLTQLGVADAEYVKNFSFTAINPGTTTFYVDDVTLIGKT